MKYLLIDGNNLAIRSAFANAELRNREGVPTGVHYGVFQSLVALKQQFLNHKTLIVWDGKSQRRIAEAQAGIDRKIISSGYKANRIKDEQPQPLQDFYKQAPFLQKGIGQTGIPQIRLPDYEADDVIASYCKKLRDNNEITVVTSDSDYYQLLHDNVSLWNGMNLQLTRKNTWEKQYGITPSQHIDCGALMGDNSDNIFGVPAWGEKTSLAAIQEFGSWQKVIENYQKLYNEYRKQFPDLKDNESEFKRLAEIKTGKADKPKYPEITIDMPYTGVALALEDKKIKGIKKTEINVLMFEERVKLAYSLKKMDDDISDLPEIVEGSLQEDKLKEYFAYYDIVSLLEDLWVFKG